ncbi:MAG: cbb3-type cytochrome oxidase assembly protein CcoS [Aquincola sp.]|nr:cbb3-type cytochrome oxidase assembly protein CcoS [Aquincola sp.]
MDILYLLIPLSSLLVLGIVGIFAWALHRGQFDDLEGEGRRILLDVPQADAASATEQSPDGGTDR